MVLESEPEIVNIRRDELLSKRRLTMLSGSDGNLLDEDLDNEEIIEGLIIMINWMFLIF